MISGVLPKPTVFDTPLSLTTTTYTAQTIERPRPHAAGSSSHTTHTPHTQQNSFYHLRFISHLRFIIVRCISHTPQTPFSCAPTSPLRHVFRIATASTRRELCLSSPPTLRSLRIGHLILCIPSTATAKARLWCGCHRRRWARRCGRRRPPCASSQEGVDVAVLIVWKRRRCTASEALLLCRRHWWWCHRWWRHAWRRHWWWSQRWRWRYRRRWSHLAWRWHRRWRHRRRRWGHTSRRLEPTWCVRSAAKSALWRRGHRRGRRHASRRLEASWCVRSAAKSTLCRRRWRRWLHLAWRWHRRRWRHLALGHRGRRHLARLWHLALR